MSFPQWKAIGFWIPFSIDQIRRFVCLSFYMVKGTTINFPVKSAFTVSNSASREPEEIAISDQSERIFAAEKGFDCYFYMASTARMLFNRATSTGGFPVEAVLPYPSQQASRTSYIVAVCMWLTVKPQRDYPNRKQLPIDVGYIGRRHVIDTREGLDRRVIKGKGDNALDLCMKIIGAGEELHILEKVNCDFSKELDPERYQESQRTLLNDLFPTTLGLVSQFSVCKNFHEKSKPEHMPETFGYWRFHGDSFDCEGEFVTMEEDGNVSTECERLHKVGEE